MSERDYPWADERLDEMATPSQIERANEAVLANLKDDGTPKWQSAQGYACALTATMLCDARLAETRTGQLYEALDAFVRHHREGGRPYTKDLLLKADAALNRAASVGRNAKRRDRGTGLGPKGEHAVGEAETPKA